MSSSPGPRTPKGTPARKVSVPFTHSSPSSLKAGSAGASLAAGTVKAQLLGRNEESTYHRKVRQFLQDHARARTMWLQLVSFDGIKAARSMSLSWEDVDNARATPVDLSEGQDSTSSNAEGLYAREKATAMALEMAEVAREELEAIMAKIQAQASKMIVVLDQARALSSETMRTKGFEFVAEQPLWGTWSMDRFVQSLADTTAPYVLSTAHLAHLTARLSFYARQADDQEDVTNSADDGPSGVPISASSLFETDDDSTADLSPLDTRRSGTLEAERRRAIKAHSEAVQAWARLPYLDEAPGQFLDQICEVEVGRWTER
ncbi:unnamed protein product [Tilletia controversa]|uniref:Uncharacterized protein n=2 Tax=Tilletia TaxID=13289 RepID=A0A177UYL4_9BASI|nr:hypothetical protein CF336_g1427 [Tilletia laevis]KAE8264088.1 hypothetical protein A4X03_0g1204 [Tilletia caries]CAD6925704.1 unnamed protein product [Tilletia controversa]KAE8203097.1 hypothetical protein CF335_g3166 [Tilletia laevis]CAD6893262.1 unnamed protein product [Tilletia caries]